MQLPPLFVGIHLATVLPAAVLGTVVLFMKKGTAVHRTLGKVYMALMAFTGLWTLLLPAYIGPRLWNHFGLLHLLSLLTLWTVPTALKAARKGNIRGHKSAMLQLYIGGILIAGSFALFAPGRYLHEFLF